MRREYQEFLQDHNRSRSDTDGRPDRGEDQIGDWACEHDLPYLDEQALHRLPHRVRGRSDGNATRDVELFTEHYRGAHAARHSQTGFRFHLVDSRGGGRSGPRPRGIEEFL